MIGKTLAHYEITAAIGKGGMGEVYQATDRKLGRNVAIKVLPEEFASDNDRVARFEREAKLLASLNHPNIAAIYGLEESKGTRFLVLELVEGQTLSERLVRGPLPVKESLELALQIAEALEAAHEKGVIHRDLKPANIKVTSEGKVKVLDFGLAKAYSGTAVGDETVLETLAEGAESGKGVLLGTPAYMSPEQASRQPADHRSDVWAFGCVLFEMLTGKVLFKGNTLSHTIAAILEREPDFDALPNNLSPAIRRLLERCLEKNPNRRWHAIADVRLEVEAAPAGSGSGEPGTDFKPQARPILSYAVAILMTALVAIPLAWYLRPVRPEPRAVTRFEFDLPEGEGETPETLFRTSILAMSPDGSQIAMVQGDGLYLRSMDELQARVLPATQGEVVFDPFFSPDGRWVGYFSPNDGQLKKVPVGGGEAVFITEVTEFTGGPSWSLDDSILYVQAGIVDGRTGRRIMRVSSNGGNPDRIAERPGGPLFAPTMLPGGRSILFAAVSSAGEEFSVVVRALESGDEKVLFTGGPSFDFLTGGYLVYQMETNVVARRFDPETWELGRPVPLVQGVYRVFAAHFDVSTSGSLVYLQSTELASGTPVWVTREGSEEEAVADSPLEVPQNPRLSPDGSRFALSVGGDVWVYDVAGRPPIKLTFDGETFPALALGSGNLSPLWTRDGQRIVYERNSDPSRQLWAVSADGSSAVPEPVSSEGHFHPRGWSADGSELVAAQLDVPAVNIVRWPIAEPEKLEAVVATTASEGEYGAALSPDGRWLAYASDQTGQQEIWIRPYLGTGAALRVSPSGGTEPIWTGQELYYLEGDAMMAVVVDADDTFDFQPPERLFERSFLRSLQPPSFDVAPDGRFLMIRPLSDDGRTMRVVVVENWIEEVKERVPAP